MEHISGIIKRVMENITVEDDKEWLCIYCGGHAPCIKPKCREALAASKKRMEEEGK